MIVLYLKIIIFFMHYFNSLEYAKEQDLHDPLASFRNQFHIPKDSNGNNWLYFTGNSLGLQPKTTQKYIQQELNDWANLGVEGHFEAKNPWLNYHELLRDQMAKIVGAKPLEVVVMNTLTTNLHLLMVSFYKPTKIKYKIVIESDAFPSDRYAVQSQLKFHGFSEEDLIEWKPRKGEELLRIEDLEHIISEKGDEIALLLIAWYFLLTFARLWRCNFMFCNALFYYQSLLSKSKARLKSHMLCSKFLMSDKYMSWHSKSICKAELRCCSVSLTAFICSSLIP